MNDYAVICAMDADGKYVHALMETEDTRYNDGVHRHVDFVSQVFPYRVPEEPDSVNMLRTESGRLFVQYSDWRLKEISVN